MAIAKVKTEGFAIVKIWYGEVSKMGNAGEYHYNEERSYLHSIWNGKI